MLLFFYTNTNANNLKLLRTSPVVPRPTKYNKHMGGPTICHFPIIHLGALRPLGDYIHVTAVGRRGYNVTI